MHLVSINVRPVYNWRCISSKGATIKTDEDTGKIVIARVMHGGAADRSGLIHAGDEVIEVNGINVEFKTPADVLAILVCIKLHYIRAVYIYLIIIFLKRGYNFYDIIV